MTRLIVKYKMHRLKEGITTPTFVEDGGYFCSGNEKIGVTYDEVEIHIPETLDVLTPTQLVDFVKTFDLKDDEGELLSSEDKETLAGNWLEERGLAE